MFVLWFIALLLFGLFSLWMFYPTYNAIVILSSEFDTVDWVSMEDIWFVKKTLQQQLQKVLWEKFEDLI